jgi:hypothetical protein
MTLKSAIVLSLVLSTLGLTGAGVYVCSASAFKSPQAQDPAPSKVTRRIGAIKAIAGSSITLTPDSGPEVPVTVQPDAHIVRIPPGEKSLKNATPAALPDLQVGDRVLVGGQAAADGSIAASSIVLMKRNDLEAHQDQERQDWQKRGMGGLVTAIDPAAATISASVTGFGGTKTILIHTSKDTVFRRYAPDSTKFEDASPSTLQELQPNDQLRARGNRSPDGTEFTAEEIVSGSFRNLAGTINSVDQASGTINVQDLLSKKAVQVKITGDSQLRKLPPEVAQRFAMRLKGSAVTGASGANSTSGSSAPAPAPANGESAQGGSPAAGGTGRGGMRSAGAPDFQQILSRLPAITLSDLHKGDAVLLVTTQGSAAGGGTAITLLGGVEPILQAAPNGGQAMMLAPWSLGGAPGGDAANQ